MPTVQIEAPAKLNLYLTVRDKRSDGFHEIDSLFLALAFCDTLTVETVGGRPKSLEIVMDYQGEGDLFAAIAPENNIISRAVALFRGRSGYDAGLKIAVQKRIPPGGGMGGGSSDAAAALLALNRLASPDANDGFGLFSSKTLGEMGAELGSDVPFFLCGACAARVSGRGERIQPLELPESVKSLFFLLVNPGFPSNTAEAYRLLDCWRESRDRGSGIGDRGSEFELSGDNTEAMSLSEQQSLIPDPCSLFPDPRSPVSDPHFSFPYSPHDWPFTNDFLPVFEAAGELGTAYSQIVTELRKLNADFAGLSGSGSTCFGVFSGREKAEIARELLSKQWGFTIVTFPLALCANQYYNSNIAKDRLEGRRTAWK